MNLRIETSTKVREVMLPYEVSINPFDNEYARVLMFTFKNTDHTNMHEIIGDIATMFDRNNEGGYLPEVVKATLTLGHRTLILHDAILTLTGKDVLYLTLEGSEFTWKLTNTKI